MCQPGRPSSAEPAGLHERLRRRLGGADAGTDTGAENGEDFILGPDLEVDPVIEVALDDKVVTMRASRRLGNLLSDYIDLWLALELFHERASLTEDGWKCLTEGLQRPLELRLAERRPATIDGALKALELARYLMENLDAPDGDGAGHGSDLGSGAWYRRLRNHLVDSAYLALKGGLLQPCTVQRQTTLEQRQASSGQRQEKRNHADQ